MATLNIWLADNRQRWLLGIAVASLAPYGAALWLGDLRRQTVWFEVAFFAAFALYGVAALLVCRWSDRTPRFTLAAIIGASIIFRAILVFSTPTLSDDMYRYVWDGRVQANGISPWEYSVGHRALGPLRDAEIYPQINRKGAVTVYPAGAQLMFAGLWRLFPDNVRWFQIAVTTADLLAGLLLIPLLKSFGLPAARALIYLWHPLAIFETAHGAHVDGLLMPLLVGACLARVKGRDGWTGALLGAATAIKLYPVLLAPALWRWRDDAGRWRAAWLMPAAFTMVVLLAYAPYAEFVAARLQAGQNAFGFLPSYANESFNPGITRFAPMVADALGVDARRLINSLTIGALLAMVVAFWLNPVADGRAAVLRCIWPIGIFTVLSYNLHPWYMLWLIPFLALALQPGRFGFRFGAWTGWWLFTGLVALAYTFFVRWEAVGWAIGAQYVPLYLWLVAPPVVHLSTHLWGRRLAPARQTVSAPGGSE